MTQSEINKFKHLLDCFQLQGQNADAVWRITYDFYRYIESKEEELKSNEPKTTK